MTLVEDEGTWIDNKQIVEDALLSAYLALT